MDEFPLIDLADLPKVLYAICMMGMAKAERVSKEVIKYFKAVQEAHDHQPSEDQILLNRVRFAEILLCVLYFDEKDTHPGSEKNLLQMEAIPEEDDANEGHGSPISLDPEFRFAATLQVLFKKYIVPSLEDKNDDTMPVSLNAFRDLYCWQEKVNHILEVNLEGIMEVFGKFMEDEGFTMASAEKVLKGIGSLLPPRT